MLAWCKWEIVGAQPKCYCHENASEATADRRIDARYSAMASKVTALICVAFPSMPDGRVRQREGIMAQGTAHNPAHTGAAQVIAVCIRLMARSSRSMNARLGQRPCVSQGCLGSSARSVMSMAEPRPPYGSVAAAGKTLGMRRGRLLAAPRPPVGSATAASWQSRGRPRGS